MSSFEVQNAWHFEAERRQSLEHIQRRDGGTFRKVKGRSARKRIKLPPGGASTGGEPGLGLNGSARAVNVGSGRKFRSRTLIQQRAVHTPAMGADSFGGSHPSRSAIRSVWESYQSTGCRAVGLPARPLVGRFPSLGLNS